MLLCWLLPAGKWTGITVSAPNLGLGQTPVQKLHALSHKHMPFNTQSSHTLIHPLTVIHILDMHAFKPSQNQAG